MNELVPASSQNNDVAVFSAPDSLSSIVRLKPSNLELVQYTSRTQGAKPGKYRDSVTGEHFDKITVVPLDIRKSRVLFPPGNDFTQKPLCRSNDGVVPSPFAQFPQARTCASCPKGQWRKEGGRNIKPECRDNLNLLVIDKESTLPAYIKFGGTGIAPFKEFLQIIERHRVTFAAKNGGIKPNLFDYVFSLSGQEVVTPKGRFFVPVFSDLGRVETLSTFGPFYEQFVVRANEYLQKEEDESVGVDDAISAVTAPNGGGSVIDADYVEA